MKLVSPFKDYWDVVLANDRDPYPFYHRQTVEYDVKDRERTAWAVVDLLRLPAVSGMTGRLGGVENTGAVAFCGRRYPFWIIADTICYTYNQVVAAIRNKIQSYDGRSDFNFLTKHYRDTLESLQGTKVNGPLYGGHWGNLNIATWAAWQEYMKTASVMPDRVFLEEKAPVIAVYRGGVIINPNLRKLNFHTIVDPYTAYQELSMFLGNNLAQQVDPIPKMTDELKAHAHGFDRWSFRTHKEDSRKAKKKKSKEMAMTPPPAEPELKLDDSDFK